MILEPSQRQKIVADKYRLYTSLVKQLADRWFDKRMDISRCVEEPWMKILP